MINNTPDSAPALIFLNRSHSISFFPITPARGERAPLEMALATLRKMAEGGMYDQIGGGFHRYSVHAQWRVPHFE